MTEKKEKKEEERSILRLRREPGRGGSIEGRNGENPVASIARRTWTWSTSARRAERGGKLFRPRVASFRGRAVFSNVFFIATNIMCVRFILYHFFTIYRTRRAKRLLYFRHFYDRGILPRNRVNFRSKTSRRARPRTCSCTWLKCGERGEGRGEVFSVIHP